MSIGRNSVVALGKETVFGTPVVPDVFGQVSNYDPAASNSLIIPDTTSGNRSPSCVIAGAYDSAPSLSIPMVPEDMSPHLIIGTLGSVSSALVGGSSGAYDHTVTQSNTTLPSYTFHYDTGTAAIRIPGTVMDTLSLSIEPNNVMSLDVGMIAKTSLISTPLVPTYSPIRKYVGYDVGVTFNGSADFNFENITLNYGNGLEGVATLNGTRLIQKVTPGLVTLSGQITVEFDDITKAELFLGSIGATGPEKNLQNVELVITMTMPDLAATRIEAGFPYQQVITIPKILFGGGGLPSVDAAGRVIQTLEWTALTEGSGELIEWVIRNGIASYA